MLAAAVLSDHADVTVIESDVLPMLPALARDFLRPAMPTCCGLVGCWPWKTC